MPRWEEGGRKGEELGQEGPSAAPGEGTGSNRVCEVARAVESRMER